MPSAQVILFERGDQWRRALRICVPDFDQGQQTASPLESAEQAPRRVIETRSLEECQGQVETYSASVVGLELAPRDAAAVVELLEWMRCLAPLSRAVLLIPPDVRLPIAEWEFRRIGAVHVIRRRRRMAEFAQIAMAHLDWIQQLSASEGITAAEFQ